MLFILLLSVYFIVSDYFSSLNNKQLDTLDKLKSIACTLSLQVPGDDLQNLLARYSDKDDIRSSKADPAYYTIHQKLNEARKINGLKSDIYTLTYDKKNQHFFFGVTSGENPYYRHIYDSHPQDFVDNYQTGGKIDRFEDKNGVWLSAIAPIKNKQDETVAVIVVDQHFDDFTAEARKLVLKDTIISITVILILSLSLRRILREMLSTEEKAKQTIEHSRQLLQEKNKQITDSIQYAKRIQEALMKENQAHISKVSDYFQIYLPRDIVSGDFQWYYMDNHTDKLYVANVDCTGHGVPGALISIIGISALQEIIVNKGMQKPNEILNMLDYHMKQLLRQYKGNNSVQDGMDIGLCVIDHLNMELKFAGAHTPLVISSDGELEVIKGNRFSIGGYQHKLREKAFTSHKINLKPKDRIYMYSDGMIDQFGGPNENSERFKTRRLHTKIKEIQAEPMNKQGQILLQTFKDWQGSQKQIDDVSMVGIEI